MSKRLYHVLTPALTFVVGGLVGVIYGHVLASQQWKEQMDEVQSNRMKSLLQEAPVSLWTEGHDE